MLLRYSDLALRDIADCARYMAKDSPERARRWRTSIEAALRRLVRFPQSGLKPRDPVLARRGFRVVIVGDILVFYLVRAGAVDVRRVIHGRRRYRFILDAMPPET